MLRRNDEGASGGRRLVGYGFRGEDLLPGQRREGCGPPHPGTEHTCRRGQSLRRHRPRLKLIQICWCDGAGRR